MNWRWPTRVLVVTLLAGCGERPEGFVWEVELVQNTDECNDPPIPYQKTFEYVLDLSSPPAVTLAIGTDVFATGRVSGCFIEYESVIWPDEKNGFDLRWQISGQASYRLGTSTCDLPQDLDWEGTEQFELVESYHPDIPEGCRYVMDATGTYQGEL